MKFIWLFLLFSSMAHATEIHGHRGARWNMPENTLPSFAYAIEGGADYIELDTHVTKDNIIVVNHDPYINVSLCQYKDGTKIAKNLAVRALTFEQIKDIDCGSKVNPGFPAQEAVPGAEIPALSEVFHLLKAYQGSPYENVKINIEIKNAKNLKLYPELTSYVEMLIDLIYSEQMQERVMIQSFDSDVIRYIEDNYPEFYTSILTNFAANLELAQSRAHSDAVSAYYSTTTQAVVKKLHAKNVRVLVWTANGDKDWQKAIAKGVDGIITDNPADLRLYLQR